MSARAWLVQPGVPAMGHIVARGGYWHPGPVEGCRKCHAPDVAPTPLTPDKHGNRFAREGCDRCECGAKYWERDVCVSCGKRFGG